MPDLTTPEVAVRTGATYRQLDHWCRTGLLDIECHGSGNRRHWPLSELAIAETMARLVKAGVKPVAAARVARGEPLAPGITVTVGAARG